MKLISLEKYNRTNVLKTESEIDQFRSELMEARKEKFEKLDRAKIESIQSAITKIIG